LRRSSGSGTGCGREQHELGTRKRAHIKVDNVIPGQSDALGQYIVADDSRIIGALRRYSEHRRVAADAPPILRIVTGAITTRLHASQPCSYLTHAVRIEPSNRAGLALAYSAATCTGLILSLGLSSQASSQLSTLRDLTNLPTPSTSAQKRPSSMISSSLKCSARSA
jgi:hypothetical protein